MGTKTVDGIETPEASEVAETSEAAETNEAAGEATKASEASDAVTEEEPADAPEPQDADADAGTDPAGPSGVGQGAGAVVSAALGVVSLTGSWTGTVAAARQTLIGQLRTSQSAGVAEQVQAVYGDAWQASALWAGAFALLALITGVLVLARPAFGAPGRPQAGWIKSVAWGGVAIGAIGLLLAVLTYTGALLGLPSTS